MIAVTFPAERTLQNSHKGPHGLGDSLTLFSYLVNLQGTKRVRRRIGIILTAKSFALFRIHVVSESLLLYVCLSTTPSKSSLNDTVALYMTSSAELPLQKNIHRLRTLENRLTACLDPRTWLNRPVRAPKTQTAVTAAAAAAAP